MMFAKIVVIWLSAAVLIFTAVEGKNRSKRWAIDRECGATDVSVYKNTIHHGQWPFIASIYYVNYDKIALVCGGTIISKFAIITAAHCIKNKGENEVKRTQDLKIRAGAFNLLNFLERESVFLTPSRVILHQDWNSFNQNFDADVALLMMQREIQFSQFIKPICLFQITDLVANIRDGWIVSYGTTLDVSNRYHVFPRKFRIPIIDTNTCLRQEPRYARQVSSRTFCAGSKTFSNICQSDLGSGLFVYHNGRFYLAGVASVSFSDGYGECDHNNVAIFANVHLMSRWIESGMFESEPKNFINRYEPKIQPATTKKPSYSVQEESIDVRFPTDDDDVVQPTAEVEPPPIPRLPEFTPPSVVPLNPTNFNRNSLEESIEPSFDPTSGNVISDSSRSTQPAITSTPPSIFQAACGVMSQVNGLIQGGQTTAGGQFPWATAIFRKSSLFGNIVDYAVGSLISYRHVFVETLMLSLVNDKRIVLLPQAEEIKLIFGFDDLSLVTEQTPFSEASDIIVHPNYVLGLPIQANIAIIILKEPIEYSRKVFPVCLWDSTTKLEDVVGKNIYSFGYGGQSIASTTKVKKFIVLKVRDQNECPADYKFILRNVKDRSPYFCAGSDRNETLCVGDSTSVFAKKNNLWYLFASVAYHDVSIRTKVCNSSKSAMFEYLGAYIKWIQNIVITM